MSFLTNCFVETLIAKCCRLYNVFGSGASHGAHAQFIAQSAIANKGRRVGLLRGATTRMASWFYAMMRVLRQKDVLKSTVHSVMFRDLAKNDKVRGAVIDIENEVFFKALYILLRAVFPAIRALRFADSNEPMMDKIYFFSQRMQMALTKSVDLFNEKEIFGVFAEGDVTLADEINEVWGE